MSFGDSRIGGTGEVGGSTQRVQTAWPCQGSALERPWLVGRAISVLSDINGLGNLLSHLLRPLFPAFKVSISSIQGLLFQLHQVGIFWASESFDWNFVKWWVWLQSRIGLAWLKWHLTAVLSPAVLSPAVLSPAVLSPAVLSPAVEGNWN